jgi:transcription antitermination factor NusG
MVDASMRTQRWHIAMMEPQRTGLRETDGIWDANACRILRARGYEVYYPAFPKSVNWGGVGSRAVRMVMRAMFPGYVLVNESARGWDGLRTTPGIRTYGSLLIDTATGRLAVLPPGEIDRIMATESRLRDQILNPQPRELPYKVGDRVKFTGGAFAESKDPYATIETLDDEERIALLKDIFGRPTRVYSSHEHLAAT